MIYQFSAFSLPNVEVKADGTSFINSYPILTFILVTLAILIFFLRIVLPKLIETFKNYKEKTKLSQIHEHTTSILEVTQKIHEKVNS